jgi:hypothetical protein
MVGKLNYLAQTPDLTSYTRSIKLPSTLHAQRKNMAMPSFTSCAISSVQATLVLSSSLILQRALRIIATLISFAISSVRATSVSSSSLILQRALRIIATLISLAIGIVSLQKLTRVLQSQGAAGLSFMQVALSYLLQKFNLSALSTLLRLKIFCSPCPCVTSSPS